MKNYFCFGFVNPSTGSAFLNTKELVSHFQQMLNILVTCFDKPFFCLLEIKSLKFIGKKSFTVPYHPKLPVKFFQEQPLIFCPHENGTAKVVWIFHIVFLSEVVLSEFQPLEVLF